MIRRRERQRLARMVALVALVVVVMGVQAGGAPGQGKEPIVIGNVIGFTGFMASFDVPPYHGQQLAVRDINKAGGVLGRPLRLATFDQKSQAPLGQTGALDLLDQGAVSLVCSADFDIGSPCALAAQNKNVPGISTAAGDPKFGAQGIGPYGYTFGNTTNAQGAVDAEYAFKARKWRNAYVIEDTTLEYTKGFTKYFIQRYTELGGKIVGHDTMLNSDPSIATQITRLKSTSPQPSVLVLATYVPGLSGAIRQIRAAGVNLPILGVDGWDGTYWTKGIKNVGAIYFPTFGYLGGPQGGQAYRVAQAYRRAFGSPPVTSFFLSGYATIQAITQAIRQARSTDPAAINKQLQRLKNFSTVVGPVTFNAKQHSRANLRVVILTFDNGNPKKLKLVTRWTAAKVPNPFG